MSASLDAARAVSSDYPTTTHFHEELRQLLTRYHPVAAGAKREERSRDLWALECLLGETGTGRTLGEDRVLLPTLVRAAAQAWAQAGGTGAGGTFVEIGAADGHYQSTTLGLERCLNWTGILIEASPSNFAALQRSGRDRSTHVHSAVCDDDGSGVQRTVPITTGGFNFAGEPDAMPSSYKKRYWSAPTDRLNSTVDVPCRPLQSILAAHGLAIGATFLSLDVEGAEEKVLRTVRPSSFGVVMVEMDGHSPRKDARVGAMLRASGMRRASSALQVPLSQIFLRGDVEERQSGRVSLDGVLPSLPSVGAGFCALTTDGPSDCKRDAQGSWPFTRKGTASAGEYGHIRQCWAQCRACEGCRFLSVSRSYRECSWFRECSLSALQVSATSQAGPRRSRHTVETDHYTLQVAAPVAR